MDRRKFLGGLVAGTAGLTAGGARAGATLLRAAGSGPRLAVVGDVGTGKPPAREVAAAMARAHAARSFDGLVMLGDNVYPDGAVSRLQKTVFDPYEPVLRRAQLSAVLGNHDVKNGNGPKQVRELDMPGRWYSRRLGDVLLVCLDSTMVQDAGQQRFLESTLASSAAWKVVALHHPLRTSGPRKPVSAVVKRWGPVFERQGVQLVLCGHEHNYQRFAPQQGVTHVVSGSGARLARADGRGTAAHANTLHFLDLTFGSSTLELEAIDRGGRTIDRATLRR